MYMNMYIIHMHTHTYICIILYIIIVLKFALFSLLQEQNKYIFFKISQSAPGRSAAVVLIIAYKWFSLPSSSHDHKLVGPRRIGSLTPVLAICILYKVDDDDNRIRFHSVESMTIRGISIFLYHT